MIWLGIDTANTPLSIAIVKDGEIITEENTSTKVNHSLRAMPAIEEAFQRAQLTPDQIDQIVVSEGPGSYTGVRIGVTIAKTLAWTLQKPLIGVSSIQALATNLYHHSGFVCPMFDARRQHVYTGVYQFNGQQTDCIVEDQHIHIDMLLEQLNEWNEQILFVGKDVGMHQEKIKSVLGERAQFAAFPDHLPRASSLILAAEQLETTEYIHHFTPEYRRIAEAEANWLKAQRKDFQDER